MRASSSRWSGRLSDEGADDEDEEQVPEARRERIDAAQREQADGEQREHEHEDGQLAPAAAWHLRTPPEARSVSAATSRLVG